MQINLKTGDLEILAGKDVLLEQLAGFGSRQNKKRGFVFVSKVLGKHYPARPAVMRDAHEQLAARIKPLLNNAPTLVIGFAETATGLGHGVFDALELPNAFYMHTTRYRLSQPRWLNFEEEHSHATSHLLYLPQDPAIQALGLAAENVVLVDDEFSTGKTLRNLVTQLRSILPQAKRFIGAAILDWRETELDGIECVSLHRGRFQFTPHPDIQVTPARSVGDYLEDLNDNLPHNFSRLGIQKLSIDWSQYLNPADYQQRKTLVLGTAEFMHPAFLLGRWLEDKGCDVMVQSTTRSPLNVDGDIEHRLQFQDNYGERIDNFLYNLRRYDKIIVCYETICPAEEHHLPTLLEPFANDVILIMPKPSP